MKIPPIKKWIPKKSVADIDKMAILEMLFLAFCFMPFIIPNPIVNTNIQPYAAMVGVLIIVCNIFPKRTFELKLRSVIMVAVMTLVVACAILFINKITVSSFRALYNYFAVAVIPFATILVIRRRKALPEKEMKVLILLWFAVSAIQFFIYRGFATEIIGGVRWSNNYRGVVGLASEPSFLGIVSFYFLHIAQKFKKHKPLYMGIILVMGVLFAQSAVGLVFIACFLLTYLVDLKKSKLRTVIWTGSATAAVVFLVLLNTVMVGTRLHALFQLLLKGGFRALLTDTSASVRFRAIINAVTQAFGNYLLPMGFSSRIGSGYGGFLCELGFLALPIMFLISKTLSRTFQEKRSRILYFFIVTLLLFNNTQIGNPLLLFTVGMNLSTENSFEDICLP